MFESCHPDHKHILVDQGLKSTVSAVLFSFSIFKILLFRSPATC